jgi:hypothetical protein
VLIVAKRHSAKDAEDAKDVHTELGSGRPFRNFLEVPKNGIPNVIGGAKNGIPNVIGGASKWQAKFIGGPSKR